VFGNRTSAERLRGRLRASTVASERDSRCEWTQLGPHAYGHTEDGRLAGVLYWDPAEPVSRDDGAPVVLTEGFYFVHAGSAGEHHHVMNGPDSSDGWTQALNRASKNLTWGRM
jgi:hypothetical protein